MACRKPLRKSEEILNDSSTVRRGDGCYLCDTQCFAWDVSYPPNLDEPKAGAFVDPVIVSGFEPRGSPSS